MAGEQGKKPLTSVQSVALVLAHIFAVLSLIIAIYWAKDDDTDEKFLGGLNWTDKVFNWHPVLMVAGFVLAYTEAILAYRTFPLGKPMNKVLHALWQTAAIACVSVGVAAAFRSHNTTEAGGYTANLYSLHSWLGISTLVLFGQQYLFALIIFGIGAAPEIRSGYLPYHVFLGTFTYYTAVFTAIAGIQEKNGFLSCKYTVTVADKNPAEHYYDLPEGCRVSNGLGLLILVTALCATLATHDFSSRSKHPLADSADSA